MQCMLGSVCTPPWFDRFGDDSGFLLDLAVPPFCVILFVDAHSSADDPPPLVFFSNGALVWECVGNTRSMLLTYLVDRRDQILLKNHAVPGNAERSSVPRKHESSSLVCGIRNQNENSCGRSARDRLFTWGKSKGTVNKEKKFYCSFFFRGEEFSLYDNVVVHDENEPDGQNIAKIMKLWKDTTTGSKMTLLRWFVRKEELPPHLKDVKDNDSRGSSKELFLAFGLGKGVCNENKLECIERKCRVVCTSKDLRNKQPSEEDIRLSEYTYSKIYNVDRKKLSNLEGIVKILGPDVLFNKPESVSCKQFNKHVVSFDLNVQPVPGSLNQGNSEKGTSVSDDLGKQVVPSEYRSGLRGIKRPACIVEDGKEKRCESMLRQETLRIVGGMTSIVSPPPVTRSGSAKMGDQHIVKVETPSIEEKNLLTGGEAMLDPEDLLKDSAYFESIMAAHAGSEHFQFYSPILLHKAVEIDIEENLHLGKVILLHNVDSSFTSADVHNLVRYAFRGCLGGQLLVRGLTSSASFVDALLVFETEDLADSALRELEDNCFVLSDCERPLVASKAESPELGKVLRFPGHFPLDNLKQWKQCQLDSLSKTFDIFHFSEPNSMEFEMAMEWKMLQRMISNWCDRLREIQEEEMTAVQKGGKKPKLMIP